MSDEPEEGPDGPPAVWPLGLRAAFDRYEAALHADDIAVLDDAFEPGPATLRADAAGLLVGHDRISAFRSARGGVPARRIGRTELRPLGEDLVIVVAESHVLTGGRGVQTQLWRRTEGVWRIAVAHVTARPAAIDRTIWRIVGDPLVRGADGTDGADSTAGLPLAGVRVAVKDLFALRGHVVGAGNPTWERDATLCGANASAVAALLDAGASVVGLARTDEFAYSIAGRNAHTGTPPNGADPERMPGGSTSGPAAAVAVGQADLALGTDTAGSVRVPASYQGLWGLRTTHDAVDREGLLPLAPTFDTVGWLARTPDLLRAAAVASLPRSAADAVVTRPEAAPPTLRGPLLVADSLLAAAEPHTRDAFAAFLRDVRVRGAELPVEHIDLPPLPDLAETVRVVQAAEAWRTHGAWVRDHRDALGPDVLARFDTAAAITPDQERAAREQLATLRPAVRAVLARGVLCLPTVPGPAPLRTATAAEVDATRTATLRMTAVAGIAGAPAVSFPALAVEGAPVGVCLVGPAGSDLALVDLATALAARVGGAPPPTTATAP